MYNIIQLNDKSLSELQAIAKELGIKKTDSLKKEDLVYKILDEQAIAGATKKVAADKLKEERKVEKQKRPRSNKKENSEKAPATNKNEETANKENTKKQPVCGGVLPAVCGPCDGAAVLYRHRGGRAGGTAAQEHGVQGRGGALCHGAAQLPPARPEKCGPAALGKGPGFPRACLYYFCSP